MAGIFRQTLNFPSARNNYLQLWACISSCSMQGMTTEGWLHSLSTSLLYKAVHHINFLYLQLQTSKKLVRGQEWAGHISDFFAEQISNLPLESCQVHAARTRRAELADPASGSIIFKRCQTKGILVLPSKHIRPGYKLSLSLQTFLPQ